MVDVRRWPAELSTLKVVPAFPGASMRWLTFALPCQCILCTLFISWMRNAILLSCNVNQVFIKFPSTHYSGWNVQIELNDHKPLFLQILMGRDMKDNAGKNKKYIKWPQKRNKVAISGFPLPYLWLGFMVLKLSWTPEISLLEGPLWSSFWLVSLCLNLSSVDLPKKYHVLTWQSQREAGEGRNSVCKGHCAGS